MTRQQDITRQQVENKIYDADKRIKQWLYSALRARTGADYEYALMMIEKAIYDRQVWKMVRDA